MAKQIIDLGTSPNKGDGDPLRTAFDKVNDNFDELYLALGNPSGATTDVLPNTNGTINLGSADKTWADLHVADFIYLNGARIEVTAGGALLVNGGAPAEVQDTVGSVFGDDSTLLVDGVNNIIPSANISGIEAANWDTAFLWGDHSAAGYAPQATTYTKVEVDAAIAAVDPFSGDVTGSVFADDSTLLVDGVNGVIPKANVESSTDWDAAFAWGDHAMAGYQSAIAPFTGDVTGSVFADDSSIMVDAVSNKLNASKIDIIGNGNSFQVYDGGFNWVTAGNMNLVIGGIAGINSTGDLSINSSSGTVFVTNAEVTGDLTGNVNGNVTGNVTGNITGDVVGSVFGDDSTLLVDGVGGTIAGPISSINWMAASDSYLTISNGGSTGPGPIQIVASANLNLSSGTNNDINITPHGSGRVKVSDGAFGIVEAANFIGHADETMYLSSKTTGAQSTHIALNSTSGVATTMYGAVDFVSGGSVDFTGSTVTGLPAAGATEINDLTDVDTATIAPSRSMQPLIWDDIDSNWYPGNGLSLTANLTMEDNSFIILRENAYINFEGSITDGFDTKLDVVNPTANRTVRLPDADGTLALTTQIPTALSDFTNDLDYAGIVGGAIQANGLPSGTTFTDTLTLPVLTAEPSSPVNGMVAVADGTSWDPMLNAAQTMVVYLAGAWRQIAQGGV